MVVGYICWIIYSKINKKQVIDVRDFQSLLKKEWTIDRLLQLEVQIAQILDFEFYSLTYSDCLDFLFFQNNLWKEEYKTLIKISKMILLR